MKKKCLDDFYKNLESRTSTDYADSIKELISQNNLNITSLTELIDEEVEK